MRSSVDLPEPFGPMSPMRLPASTRRSTASRTVRGPWWRVMRRASRRVGGIRGPFGHEGGGGAAASGHGGGGTAARGHGGGRLVWAAVSERHAYGGPEGRR